MWGWGLEYMFLDYLAIGMSTNYNIPKLKFNGDSVNDTNTTDNNARYMTEEFAINWFLCKQTCHSYGIEFMCFKIYELTIRQCRDDVNYGSKVIDRQ